MDDRPIGMFDSGFGGLTVARALIDLMPAEDLVYVADTGRYPYGPRSQAEVRRFAFQITRKLVDDHKVKMVVVACNTATAAALEDLRYAFDVPLVGVIDPGVRSLLKVTQTGRVGVIGTVGTIGSGAYQRAVADYRFVTSAGRRAQLTCAACPGLVELVERGETRSDQALVLTERLLAPVRQAHVDALLLGCTHYPFLARTISEVMGPDVVLVSSADETAFDVRSILLETGLYRRGGGGPGSGRPGRSALAGTGRGPGVEEGRGTAAGPVGARRWVSSGEPSAFVRLGQQLFGPELDHAEHWAAPEG